MSADDIIRHLTDSALSQNGFIPHHLAAGDSYAGDGLDAFVGGRLHHYHQHGDGFFDSVRSGARHVYKWAAPHARAAFDAAKPALRAAGNEALKRGQDHLLGRLKAM